MSFFRSPEGISNYHIFSRKSAIVYVEGGLKTLKLSQLLQNKFEVNSIDVKFWSSLFETFIPKSDVEFRAVGSKKTLLELAELIEEKQIEHVLVAMDRDYDNHLGKLVNGSGILYTYGYGWENDVWNPETIAIILDDLLPADGANKKYKANCYFAEFRKKLKDFFRVNVQISFFNERLVLNNNTAGLFDPVTLAIDEQRVADVLKNKDQAIRKTRLSPNQISFNVSRDVPCHIIGTFGKSVLGKIYFDSLKSKFTMNNEALDSLAISVFKRNLDLAKSGRLFYFYRKQFKNLKI